VADSRETARLEEHARAPRVGLAAELLAFLMDNKKWWLAPILIVTLGLGGLILLGGSAAAPFIYTLF
jgi:hypothetical protein